MPIEISYGELISARSALDRLLARQVSMIPSMRLARRIKVIEGEIARYERRRHGLIIKHGRPVKGGKGKIAVGATFIDDSGSEVPDPKWKEYQSDLDALNGEKISLPMEKIPPSELDLSKEIVVCPDCKKEIASSEATVSLDDLVRLADFLTEAPPEEIPAEEPSSEEASPKKASQEG